MDFGVICSKSESVGFLTAAFSPSSWWPKFLLSLSPLCHLFRDQIFPRSKSSTVLAIPSKLGDGSGDSRDFIAKMINGVSTIKI